MKFTIPLVVMVGIALAYLGIGIFLSQLEKQHSPQPVVMIGDLINGSTTLVGNQVKDCLLGTGECQDLTPKVNPQSIHSIQN